ncbi:hypothetical protein LWI28_005281 [Acer negundo]|uniref:Uncharacterized protein n=1 Tax=Acer negundo TaxID=4023 RepID=A0AAD5J872_ACENE|nr:hypothetical protein LWI28_005281 [Acer negundo]
MVAKASRVRSMPGQIQRQAPATSSMKAIDQSPTSPPPLPPIVPSRSQLWVDRAKETAEGEGVLTMPEVPEIEGVQAEAVTEAADGMDKADQGLELVGEQGDA